MTPGLRGRAARASPVSPIATSARAGPARRRAQGRGRGRLRRSGAQAPRPSKVAGVGAATTGAMAGPNAGWTSRRTCAGHSRSPSSPTTVPAERAGARSRAHPGDRYRGVRACDVSPFGARPRRSGGAARGPAPRAAGAPVTLARPGRGAAPRVTREMRAGRAEAVGRRTPPRPSPAVEPASTRAGWRAARWGRMVSGDRASFLPRL